MIALLAEGKLGRNAVARASGISGSTVSRIAADVGHDFARATQTAAASAARSADQRADRRRLADRLVVEAEADLDRRPRLDPADTRAAADLARSSAALVRAAVDLDRLELDRARSEREAAVNSGSDLDLYLTHLAGGEAAS